MGKSAKIFKRPNKKEKEQAKISKQSITPFNETPSIPEDIPSQIPERKEKKPILRKQAVHQPYSRPNKPQKTNEAKGSKPALKNTRILEGRPDYVDLMYSRTKPKKK